MIDYPGEILRRFGRYQAVESIRRGGLTDLWRAWDPYLERFVVVVVLHGEDPSDVPRRMSNLGEALQRWTGKVRDASQVLDFEPGSGEEKPFLVLAVAEDDELERKLLAGPVPSRSSALSRHWDLLVAAGGMLFAGVLAWMLRGVFRAPPERPVVRPPAAVAATEARREAARTASPPRTPRTAAPLAAVAAGPGTAAPTSTATASPRAAAPPTALDMDLLVGRWLTGYCRGIEDRYEQRGREQWRCSWRDKQTSGSLPTVEVDFTRVERAVEPGRGAALELLTREHFRLTCADAACRRLVSVPGTGRRGAAKQAGRTRSTKNLPPAASPQPPNHPPVVEILAAPRRAVPGGRVILGSRVTDPDTSRGDEVECVWSVDGKPVARLCWELVWIVPKTKGYGSVTFTLTARDRRGASDSKSVSVFVGPRQ